MLFADIVAGSSSGYKSEQQARIGTGINLAPTGSENGPHRSLRSENSPHRTKAVTFIFQSHVIKRLQERLSAQYIGETAN